jgi:hypothetical protein
MNLTTAFSSPTEIWSPTAKQLVLASSSSLLPFRAGAVKVELHEEAVVVVPGAVVVVDIVVCGGDIITGVVACVVSRTAQSM